ncbi:MAG: plasmid mobilization relaxosome protein MobC [Clostridia bacterium]|nr:plasmid mobilization relaxosome protein MobC [Clostridia bacterium]
MKDLSFRKHLIKAYLDDSEYEKFTRIAKCSKRSNSQLVRDMLEKAIFVEYPPAKYDDVLYELRKIGINLNQLAEKAHTFGFIDSNDYRKNTNRLWKALADFARIYVECGAQIEEEKERQKEEQNRI